MAELIQEAVGEVAKLPPCLLLTEPEAEELCGQSEVWWWWW